jgi:glutamate dehydrogenase/leucine dehydrogenase
MGPETIERRLAAGVEMIIAIDSTVRGPALGGCRWKPYPDSESAAAEAVALARAMTRKAAMARLRLGGGKAVVVGDARTRTREQLRAFGAFVEELGGRYVTGADMGTGEPEMRVISETTRHVVGLARADGGCGDPGPFTALGVRLAIRAALAECGLDVHGATIAIQGAGSVGSRLASLLLEDGARVIAADPSRDAVAALPAAVRVVDPQAVLATPCDVFAPCGPPRVIDAASAQRLHCRVVCGAANNPLGGDDAGQALARRGILYVPDFVANAGGLIHLATALEGGDDAASRERLAVIPENLAAVLACAKESDLTTAAAADRLAAALLA